MSAAIPVDEPTGERVTRRVAVSTVSQIAARGFDVLVNIAVSLAILRHLGPRGYGDFVLVVTVAGLVGLVAELGLPKLSVREVARDGETAGEVIGTVVVIRLVLSVVAAAGAQLVLLAFGADGDVHLAALIASSMFVAEALLTVTVVFHVALRQQYEAIARLAANVVKLVVVVALVASDAGLVPLVAATTVTLLVAAVVAWLVARTRFAFRAQWRSARVRPLLREALPVWPAMLAGVVFLKLDALMVAIFGTRHDVGIYGAAYQPVEYVLLASAVILHVLFPLAARAYMVDRERFTAVYRRGTELLLVVLLPASGFLLVAASDLTRVAYQERFADAAAPMAILGVALTLLSLNAWQGLVLLAADQQRVNVVYLAIAVVFNIAIDCILVPWLGPVGAAWGTLASGVLVVACSTYAVNRFAGAHLAAPGIVRVGIAGATFTAFYAALHAMGVQWFLAAIVAGLTYPPALLALRVIDGAELRAALGRSGAATPDLVGSAT